MHCYTGSLELAKKMLDLNSYFSASGIITFKKSTDLNNTFNFIPSDKILIETDSPFLAPVPKRGKTNEPSYLKYTLEHMAKIKNISSQEMELITSLRNDAKAKEFFYFKMPVENDEQLNGIQEKINKM